MFSHPHDWRRKSLVLVLLTTTSCCFGGEIYRPKDTEVVENLPAKPLLSRNQLILLQRKLIKDPRNIELASSAAFTYLKMGKSSGDPRYYGYAQAVIEPWKDNPTPPAPIAKLRAKLCENNHEYGKALAELESLLQRKPKDAQAWIEVGSLYRVKGEYAKAWEACESLAEHGNALQVAVSRIPLMAVNGQAAEAASLLEVLLPKAKREMSQLVHWVRLMQADIARIMGRASEADSHFRAALAESDSSIYLKRAFAEFLLDQDQPQEAFELIRTQLQDNGSLLLATIAARRSGHDALADVWQSRLETRYEELRLRGSQPHGRFEARYNLEVVNDPEKALKLAMITWQQQKEARDMRNVLQAAIATEQPEAAQPVLDFMKVNGTEDVELRKLAAQLESK